jgi:gamma-glutamyltranspeptidase/glutathione hydrolase
MLLGYCKLQIEWKKQLLTGLLADKACVSAREEASEIAVAIMKKGGNAFDAMVATSAVCYPSNRKYRRRWFYGL